MKTILNKRIRKIIENSEYYNKEYNESLNDVQNNMNDNQYYYNITTADNIIHFIYKSGSIDMQLKDFDWKILWDKLGNIPTNEDEEIEESFEHFPISTEIYDIWHWFEWFFDIQLGGNVL